jgi:hypothetical protein
LVALDEACRRKVQQITRLFQTQHNRQLFTGDTFMSLLRLRGIESVPPSGYAEGFFCRKAVFDVALGV